MAGRVIGIRTVDDLRLRSYVDEVSGCWHWRMARDRGGFPVGEFKHPTTGERLRRAGSHMAWVLAHGRSMRTGRRAVRVCTSADCVNPAHIREMTWADHGRFVAKRGDYKGDAQRCEINRKTARARSKINEAIAREIRRSELSGPELAALYGVSRSLVANIRCGHAWKEAQPANSVFDWARAA